jgi:hypothetical protein
MGCSGFGVDPEIAKILATLDLKYDQFIEVFQDSVKKAKNAREEQLKKRKEALEDLKAKNELTEEKIKKLNKEELLVDIQFLENEAGKMHYIFTVGLELVEPIRKVTLDKLMEKAKSAPAIALNKINQQIEEVKKIPVIEFLNSTYGKVLKDALEKKGMSAIFLKGFKNQLLKERRQRRKVEREEFGIEKNEFDDENMDELKLNLYELIQQDIEDGAIEKNYREYVRGKMVEAWLGNN